MINKSANAAYLHLILKHFFIQVSRGLTVRIAGFHPAGPGSTPGVGICLLWAKLMFEPLSLFFLKGDF